MVESIFLPIGSQLPLKCRLCLFRAGVSLVSLGSNCLQMGYIIIIFFFKSKHIEDLIIRSFIYLYPSKRKVPIKTFILKDNLLMLIYKNDKDFETYTRNWFFLPLKLFLYSILLRNNFWSTRHFTLKELVK